MGDDYTAYFNTNSGRSNNNDERLICKACVDKLPSNYNHSGASYCSWSCSDWATGGYCSDSWSSFPPCITGTPAGTIRASCCAACQPTTTTTTTSTTTTAATRLGFVNTNTCPPGYSKITTPSLCQSVAAT